MNRETETAHNRQDLQHRPSQLFLLRVWLRESGESKGLEDWHGRVQHAVTGEAHYFHGCSELVRVLRGMIPQAATGRASGTIGDSDQEGQG